MNCLFSSIARSPSPGSIIHSLAAAIHAAYLVLCVLPPPISPATYLVHNCPPTTLTLTLRQCPPPRISSYTPDIPPTTPFLSRTVSFKGHPFFPMPISWPTTTFSPCSRLPWHSSNIPVHHPAASNESPLSCIPLYTLSRLYLHIISCSRPHLSVLYPSNLTVSHRRAVTSSPRRNSTLIETAAAAPPLPALIAWYTSPASSTDLIPYVSQDMAGILGVIAPMSSHSLRAPESVSCLLTSYNRAA